MVNIPSVNVVYAGETFDQFKNSDNVFQTVFWVFCFKRFGPKKDRISSQLSLNNS